MTKDKLIAEYLARANEAEHEAQKAMDPATAENWRRIANAHRLLLKFMGTRDYPASE
jgi:hypothetical protein